MKMSGVSISSCWLCFFRAGRRHKFNYPLTFRFLFSFRVLLHVDGSLGGWDSNRNMVGSWFFRLSILADLGRVHVAWLHG